MSLRRRIWRFPVTIKQYTGMVVDEQAIATSLTINRQPTEAVNIRFNFDDMTDYTGTIVINGTETLTITSNKTKQTRSIYTSLTSITTSGLSGRIWATAIVPGGEELRILKATLTSETDPAAYMMIQERDARDVEILFKENEGFTIVTSHVGFCHMDLAKVLKQFDEVIDMDGVEFIVKEINRPPADRYWSEEIYNISLNRRGWEAVL